MIGGVWRSGSNLELRCGLEKHIPACYLWSSVKSSYTWFNTHPSNIHTIMSAAKHGATFIISLSWCIFKSASAFSFSLDAIQINAIQQGNLPSLSSGRTLEERTRVTSFSYINQALLSRAMVHHTGAKPSSQHPANAAGSCIGSSGFESGWQFFRCLNLVFVFIARPGAKLPRLFLLFIIIITVRGSMAKLQLWHWCWWDVRWVFVFFMMV